MSWLIDTQYRPYTLYLGSWVWSQGKSYSFRIGGRGGGGGGGGLGKEIPGGQGPVTGQ